MSTNKSTPFIIMAASCCFVACIGDFAVTFLIGSFYRDYNFLTQSESYLGNSKSPVAIYMSTWGIIFSLLFILYAYALKKTIFANGLWQLIAVWLIVIYGLGEGFGSGLFPYDYIGNKLTLSAKLHSTFSIIGDAAMFFLPYAFLGIFPKRLYPKIHAYSWFVGISGPLFIIFFNLAGKHIIPYKGLWQRIYLLDYYSLIMTVTLDMLVDHFSKMNTK